MKHAVVVKNSEEPATVPRAEDALPYVREMLAELRAKAEHFDWLLAHLIEMAHLQAVDIESGMVRSEKQSPQRPPSK